MKKIKKVLIIEDDKSLARVLQIKLKAEDVDTLFVQSGERGIDVAYSGQPDLILLDMMLPGMGGGEVLQELRSKDETKDIPVIVLTNIGDDMSVISEVVSLEASDYFVKANTSIETIVDKIKERLAENRLPLQ